jgi:hypothetical protein
MTVSVHLPGLAINTSVSWGLDVDGLDMANLDQLVEVRIWVAIARLPEPPSIKL